MARIFINYRSIDNPWGAAGIHEWLSRRFTSHRIFRDCASLDAGNHYPTAIMAELEKADLLIAIIGPHWLTAADPETGQRLVDRPTDWVRRELAFAFEHDIPVLPVLLKDTPDDAHHPTATDLPHDIRLLASLQAIDVSQRHLSRDLDNLAQHILRLLPTSDAPPDRPHPTRDLPPETLFALVDALEAIPCLATEDTRSVLINQLRPAIAGTIRYSPLRRIHTINLIRTCLDHEGGLAEMIATIRHLEGDESIPLRRLIAVAHALPPDLRPDECPT